MKGANVLTSLKKEAVKHGIKTVNPLMHLACIAALYSTLPEGTKIGCDSPLSERIPSKGHTLCTGNYVSAHATKLTLRGDLNIWDEGRTYARKSKFVLRVHYPSASDANEIFFTVTSERAAARKIFGELGAYIRETDKASFVPTAECSTLIEQMFYDKQHKKNPYRSALSLSNLGAIRGLPPYIEDVFWTQLCSPIGTPFNVNVCGFAQQDVDPNAQGGAGLSITVGLRKGVIDVEKEEAFTKALSAAIRAFEEGIDEGCTMAEVAAKIKAM
ncbi:hypothetical protein CBS101457_000031 [Exobasidium rhododendri]|nr:hypothetical protein CBS101457_000031 [Exobasidium rhododendri]